MPAVVNSTEVSCGTSEADLTQACSCSSKNVRNTAITSIIARHLYIMSIAGKYVFAKHWAIAYTKCQLAVGNRFTEDGHTR
jgi:hypothetical protein